MRYLLLIILLSFFLGLKSQNVVIVIIDGARYSETFGDPNRIHVPKMAEIAKQGTLLSEFYNDSMTYTSRAIPTIWCGTWTNTIDTVFNGSSTQYTTSPSLFEYYRKQKAMPPEKCIYVLKYLPSLWLPSFHKNYGSEFWPLTISEGENDTQVLENALDAMETYHPELSVVYFADVDSYGHSGIWPDYTHAIENADSAVGELWQFIQSDSFYKDNTVMFVTNDHGRHDNDHGGFKGHGCSCDGCRHIMFLAVGKGIRKNYVSDKYFRLPDVAVTAASVLELNAEKSTGEVMDVIFEGNELNQNISEPEVFLVGEHLYFTKSVHNPIDIKVINLKGMLVDVLHFNKLNKGERILWNNGDYTKGLYLVSIVGLNMNITKKVVLN